MNYLFMERVSKIRFTGNVGNTSPISPWPIASESVLDCVAFCAFNTITLTVFLITDEKAV